MGIFNFTDMKDKEKWSNCAKLKTKKVWHAMHNPDWILGGGREGDCYKRHYWENWQNFNADYIWDKSTVVLLNLLNMNPSVPFPLDLNTILGHKNRKTNTKAGLTVFAVYYVACGLVSNRVKKRGKKCKKKFAKIIILWLHKRIPLF